MTDRDLILRRVTDTNGNTHWKETPLLEAAQKGGLLVLDGLHRLSVGALAAIHGLLFDRDLWLPDGTHLVSEARYQRLRSREHESTRLRRLATNFRVVALCTPQSSKVSEQWITAELLPLFSWHKLPKLDDPARLQVMSRHSPEAAVATLEGLLQLSGEMQDAAKGDTDWKLSLRQLLRLSRHAASHSESLQDVIHRTVMSAFWPVSVREPFEQLVAEHFADKGIARKETGAIAIKLSNTVLDIGGARLAIAQPEHPELVPRTLFFENSRHLLRLRDMARDLSLGNKHLLLIGNQGTGKNKLVDHLLQLLRWEREYIQLHRDTTVQSLTVQPTLEAGVVGYEDSPLVRAARLGRTLVCDEADKAPTEVVCILKGLVEDGEMYLSDGRRLLRSDQHGSSIARDELLDGVVPIHPNFRLFVLANRPGFPFLGNDFFRECGDVFAVHVVENPDQQSEVEMLRNCHWFVGALGSLESTIVSQNEFLRIGVAWWANSLRALCEYFALQNTGASQ